MTAGEGLSLRTEGLTDEEQAALQGRLWGLLSRRTAQYTLGDSSSVPEKLAGELLESLCFTLEEGLEAEQAPPRRLVTEPLDALLLRGQDALRVKTAETERLWRTACLSAPDIDNIALRDTLRSIGGFFRQYDLLFLAHQIPCDIDYQLLCPVSGELRGVEYLREYLRRIVAENALLRAFSGERVARLLERSCPDYRGLLINLCEPVLLNAAGLALLGGDIGALGLTEEERHRLAEHLAPLNPEQGRQALVQAARMVCAAAGLGEGFAADYLAGAAAEQWPRAAAALAAGDLSEVFFSLK